MIVRGILLISAGIVLSFTAIADEQKLDEVVVTALRDLRTEQSAPVFVSVIEPEETFAGQQSVLSLSSKAPAIRFMQSSGPLTTSARIHGIGNLGNLPNFETDVGVYLQGAYLARQGLLTPQLFDISSIEVVSGSQSTLYGRNVNAGAVVVSYQEPTAKAASGATFMLGSAEGARTSALAGVTGYTNQVFDEPGTTSIRVSYKLSKAGAIDKNAYAPSDDKYLGGATDAAIRFQLATVLGSTRINWTTSHSHSTSMQGDSDVYYGTSPAALNSAFAVTCPDNIPDNGVQCVSHGLRGSLLHDNSTLRVSSPVSEALVLNSVSSWSQYRSHTHQDADQLNINLLEFNDQQKGRDLQQEFRLEWRPTEALTGVIGVYGYTSDFDRVPVAGEGTFELGGAAPFVPLTTGFSMGTPGANGSLLSFNDDQQISVFSSIAYQLASTVKLEASARYIDDEKATTIHHQNSPVAVNLINASLLPASVDADLHRRSNGVAWNVSPQWQINHRTLVFANVASGFKPGGFNADWGTVLSSRREFQDEIVKHRAIGLKWRSPSEILRLSAVAFDDEYSSYQDGAFVGLQFQVGNAEKVTSRGLDLSVDALVLPHTSATITASYADTKYDQFTKGSCYYGRTPDSTTATGACNLSGEQLPNAPKLKASFSIKHRIESVGEGLDTEMTLSRTSSYLSASSLEPRSKQDDTNDLNVRVTANPSSQLSVALWGNNLLNQRSKLAAAYMNLFSGNPAYQVFLSPGRSVGVTAGYSF